MSVEDVMVRELKLLEKSMINAETKNLIFTVHELQTHKRCEYCKDSQRVEESEANL